MTNAVTIFALFLGERKFVLAESVLKWWFEHAIDLCLLGKI